MLKIDFSRTFGSQAQANSSHPLPPLRTDVRIFCSPCEYGPKTQLSAFTTLIVKMPKTLCHSRRWRRLSRFQILVYDAEGTGHIVGEWRALHTARQQRLLFLPLSTELAVVSSA